MIFLIAVILYGEYNWSMFGLKKCEYFNWFDNFLETYRRRRSVSVFDNGFIITIMNIDFYASESILKVDEVSFCPAATEQLVSCEVSVMRRVTMIIIERFWSVDFDIFIVLIDEVILRSEHVVTEIIKRQRQVLFFIQSFYYFSALLFSL